MTEVINHLFQWVRRRWRSAGLAVRCLYALLLVVVVVGLGFVTPMIPGLDILKDMFSRAPVQVQTAVLSTLVALAVLVAAWGMMRNSRVAEVKEEITQLRARLAAAEAEVRQHQERLNHLLDVEARAGIWQRPHRVLVPPFVPASQRPTRFLTVINLKGGVGKTTLTANLAACLGLGSPPRKVLLIDIDFQGTLGGATVEKALIEAQARHGSFVNQLLTAPEADDSLLNRLAVPMNQVAGVKVILATDTLDIDEFHLQARFFVDDRAEPRFQFRRHLHRQAVFDEFDLVIFDCPPRITTSVVNAMLCSDYVLIPTRLDPGSIDAVPRTLAWMRSLGPLCPADVVGVVASHVAVRAGQLTKADRRSYEHLRGVVQSQDDKNLLFEAVIPTTPSAVGSDRGLVASLRGDGRDVFTPFVAELRRRMPI